MRGCGHEDSVNVYGTIQPANIQTVAMSTEGSGQRPLFRETCLGHGLSTARARLTLAVRTDLPTLNLEDIWYISHVRSRLRLY